jgi:hypothetical protein
MADSQVIWSASTASNSAEAPCERLPALVSADGNAISCSTFSFQPTPTATGKASGKAPEKVSFRLTFRTYYLSARTTAVGPGTIAYQVTVPVPNPGVSLSATLWTSPNGATLIGEWATGSEPSEAATPSPSSATPSPGGAVASASVTLSAAGVGLQSPHIGVIRGGKFSPLRLPPGFFAVPALHIAW